MEPQGVKKKDLRETIREMKERMRQQKRAQEEAVMDPFEKADRAFSTSRKQTGLVYDDCMTAHECTWDKNYPECPARYTAIKNRFTELGLEKRCRRFFSTKLGRDEVQMTHAFGHFEETERISTLEEDDMEEEAAKYDAIYFNKHTFDAAATAGGCVLTAVEQVVKGNCHNAFALVRPPGHHAMKKKYCGYCYFNNVAIAAKTAIMKGWVSKVLIVDFDVHHGQGTQQMFYDDSRVLYFSFHRYEHGTFWPHLRESNFDFVGEAGGAGYNINVPLNATGLEDKDYFAVIFNILLPIAYEFNPELVIFSAGYDACIGCPEGEMNLSPGFYGQLITLLGGLAHGRQVVCLEGGYNLESLAEGAAMTLKGLLDDAPAMVKPFDKPDDCIIEVINNLRYFLQNHWQSLKSLPHLTEIEAHLHKVHVKHFGVPPTAPFETRNCYPVQSEETKKAFSEKIVAYKTEYAEFIGSGVCYAFDEVMYNHKTPENIPETPERLEKIYEKFTELKLDERLKRVESRQATREELVLIHDEKYVDSILNGSFKPKVSDIHYVQESIEPILTSAGCLLSVVDDVMTNNSKAGVAMVRPPGHHAERNHAMGFCFINNIALAAQYILKKYKVNRILIIDFDVHHGNGTQKAFYNSNQVLYISLHQYNQGNYFPLGNDGNFNKYGEGHGVGFNVNIPFNKDSSSDFMSDTEYISTFHQIILPIAYSFGPEVVLVSAGFDAGLNDPIGNYKVTPEAFGHFIQMLKPLARGKLILSLEGGYNVNTVAYSMIMCIKALLGDGIPCVNYGKIRNSALVTFETVMQIQKRFWPMLQVKKNLPGRIETYTDTEGNIWVTEELVDSSDSSESSD